MKSLVIVEITIEFFFIIDFIGNFFTTFRDDEENLVINLKEIRDKYTFSWLFYDMLFAFPFEFISFFFTKEKLIFIFSYLKWLKILRMGKVFRQETTGRFLSHVVLNENYALNRIFKFGFVFLFLTHISSCFFLFLGLNINQSENWLINSNIEENYLEMYVASLYFNLVTIFSIGYGDILPTSFEEKIWVIIFMMTGSMLYSYAVSSLSNIFLEKNNKHIEYKRKLNILNSIIEEYKVPTNIFYKILQTIKKDFKKNENERYEFLDSLPSKIKNDLAVVMYKPIIDQLKYFNNQPHDFMLYVLPMLKHENVFKGDILLSVGDKIEEMYFILNGCLSMNLGPQYDNLEVGNLKKGHHFGDLLMHLNIDSPYEIICKRNSTELFILKKIDFMKIKTSYSNNVYDILDESSNIMLSVDKRKQLFITLFKYYKNTDKVEKKMSQLNQYLFVKGFDEYFDYDLDFPDIHDFIIKYNDEEIIEFLNSLDFKIKEIKRKYPTKTNKLNTIPEEKELCSKGRNIIDDDISVIREKERTIHLNDRIDTSLFKNDLQNKKSKGEKRITTYKEDFKSIYRQISRVFEKSQKTDIEERENIIKKRTLQLFSKKSSLSKKKSVFDKKSVPGEVPKKYFSSRDIVFNFSKNNNINNCCSTTYPNPLAIVRTVEINLVNDQKDIKLIISNQNTQRCNLLPLNTEKFSILPDKIEENSLDGFSEKSCSIKEKDSYEFEIFENKFSENCTSKIINKKENFSNDFIECKPSFFSPNDLSEFHPSKTHVSKILQFHFEDNKRLDDILKLLKENIFFNNSRGRLSNNIINESEVHYK